MSNNKFKTYLSAKDVKVTNQDNGETTTIASGSPLSLACVRTGMRLSFQCKQGIHAVETSEMIVID